MVSVLIALVAHISAKINNLAYNAHKDVVLVHLINQQVLPFVTLV